jgi:hypothetical protein
MPDRFSIPWRPKAGACLASVTLPPSRFVQPEPIDFNDHDGRTQILGNPDDLKSFIKPGEWNQVETIADGHTLIHIVNDHVMSTLVDTDPKYYQAKGLIAFEIEGPGNLKISHRNVWLKRLP